MKSQTEIFISYFQIGTNPGLAWPRFIEQPGSGDKYVKPRDLNLTKQKVEKLTLIYTLMYNYQLYTYWTVLHWLVWQSCTNFRS